MSGGKACTCKPQDRAKWRILKYRSNNSAFNGYRTTPSDYSSVACDGCGSRWRTKATYIDGLRS